MSDRQRARVLIVEDEPDIAELLRLNLAHSDFDPVIATDAVQARAQVQMQLPQAILLDWMLPGESGLQLARAWRADARTRDVPILMLTARGDEPDRVAGLDAGADDYIVKPFSAKELMARLRAVLRRRLPEQAGKVLSIGPISADPATVRVTVHGQAVKMGPTEFRLLQYLLAHPNRVHSRAQLLDKVWGDHVFLEERTVDVHIKRLREALSASGDAQVGAWVQTVRGMGYQFSAPQA